jgi:HK97 family phage major capsid protein
MDPMQKVAQLRDELKTLLAKGDAADPDELSRVGDQLEEAMDRVPATEGGADGRGGMVFPARGARKAQPGGVVTPASASGLKAGYWSEPVRRYMEADGNTKALTSGSIVVPALTSGLVTIPDRPRLVTDVIPSQRLSATNIAAYLVETTRTHAAAEVAEGALKPTSTYTVSKVEEPARTIATLSEPVNRHDLEDARLLSSYVEGSLAAAVRLRLDTQVVSGDGTAPNLSGMLDRAGIQTQAFSVSAIETARKALSKLYAIEIESGVYVIPIAIWEAIELAQQTSGAYALPGGPVDVANRKLWGQRVVVSSVLTGTTGVLFAPEYTLLFERKGVAVDWSEAPVGSQAGHAAFKSDELVFRAEGRWAFAVTKPTAIVQIAFA